MDIITCCFQTLGLVDETTKVYLCVFVILMHQTGCSSFGKDDLMNELHTITQLVYHELGPLFLWPFELPQALLESRLYKQLFGGHLHPNVCERSR